MSILIKGGTAMRAITAEDLHYMFEGTHRKLYEIFGAHFATNQLGEAGVHFRLYAPHAKEVGVVGDFNQWDRLANPMIKIDVRGIWEVFIPILEQYTLYKYDIVTPGNEIISKADPFAFFSEKRPGTASVVYDLSLFPWVDDAHLQKCATQNQDELPLNIYEVHLGGWKRPEREIFKSSEELAKEIIPYVKDFGFTHLEVMPVMEHPLDASWGYQITGYYSATHRYGNPKQIMHFVQAAHSEGLGVIYDWVPVHFCKDAHGLYCFDGEEVFGYQDETHRENYQWGTANFDLTSGFVRSFLISNALFWFDYYHFDGIRIDAVANLIYHQGSESKGENQEGLYFIKALTTAIHETFPNKLVIAEDSTAYPKVTSPVATGGLGFNYKWNLGWMNDTFSYMKLESLARQHHHTKLNFSYYYMMNEKYVLPFSHDEVVHGKKSVIDKIAGTYEEKFQQARLLYMHMYTHPGKKLLFMGSEFGHFREFDENIELDWFLLDYPAHQTFNHFMRSLMYFYREEKSLYERDFKEYGFKWLFQSEQQNLLCFMRKANDRKDSLIVIHNFSGATYENWYLGVPAGTYLLIFNSDATEFGGSGSITTAKYTTKRGECHEYKQHLVLDVPPFSSIILRKLK